MRITMPLCEGPPLQSPHRNGFPGIPGPFDEPEPRAGR